MNNSKQKQNPPATRKILCLQGFAQNAQLFEKRLKTLLKRLKNKRGIDLVFVNAPHKVTHPDPESTEESLGWFYFENMDEDYTKYHSMETAPYVGIQESLDLLKNKFIEEQGFEGIIGFSQGASVASILTKQIELDPDFPFKGFFNPTPVNYDWYKDSCGIPALNIMGKTDQIIDLQRSLKLSQFFQNKNSKIFEHEGGHYIPLKVSDTNVIEEFIDLNTKDQI